MHVTGKQIAGKKTANHGTSIPNLSKNIGQHFV